MALDEFDLITEYFTRPALTEPRPPEVRTGIGDDAALLAVGDGREMAVSVDMLTEGVHFPSQADPRLIAGRALRVNLSDLAAMGAEPICFTLALSLPSADPGWLEGFSRGLAEVAAEYRCVLIGGDVTRGPLAISIQVHGRLPAGQALRRSGASVGDDILVTGTLGDAAAGLALVAADCAVVRIDSRDLGPAHRTHLESAYWNPEPRIRAALALRGLASAAIDVSDGLASDLRHLLRASAVGGEVDPSLLPLSEAFRDAVPDSDQYALALEGGDDYELCFTVPASSRQRVDVLLGDLGMPVTRIGSVVEGSDIHWLCRDGGRLPTRGYRHFTGGL